MGIFGTTSKELARFDITMWSANPTNEEIVGVVNHSVAENSEKELDIYGAAAYIVPLYYAKMLYNLGDIPAAHHLVDIIDQLYLEIDKHKHNFDYANILPKYSLEMNMPEEYMNSLKTYSAHLKLNKHGVVVIQTYMSFGQELKYAPASVLFLIKYLIGLLGPNVGFMSFAILKLMNDIYSDKEPFTTLRGMSEVPYAAMNLMTGMLNKQ